MLKCRYGCNRQYHTLADMETHRKACHPNASAAPAHIKRVPVVACHDCNQSFVSIDALRQHQSTKPNHIRSANGVGSMSCDNCQRTLRSQDALEQHFIADHSLIQLAKNDSMRAQLEKEFLFYFSQLILKQEADNYDDTLHACLRPDE